MRIHPRVVVIACATIALVWPGATPALAAEEDAPSSALNLGPNVFVFDPSMPQSTIQSTVDAVAVRQVNNQFGTARYAFLFKPGTYGSSTNPLIFQVGYYTTVAGLGLSPKDVVIDGAIDVFNQCTPGSCLALNNFWRSLSNLTITVTLPKQAPAYAPAAPEDPGCVNTNDLFAVSQASPIRRLAVNGFFSLMDYCGPKDFASGGFIADSQLQGVLNGSQQQWITRNSKIDFWTNAVWNQVFSGVIGAPDQSPPAAFANTPYTTLAASPVTREAPFLYVDSRGKYNVFVPAVQRNSRGTTWAGGAEAGASMPIDRFFVARPSDRVSKINAALRSGKSLILTPGVYRFDRPVDVSRAGTVVLGLGMATLVAQRGNAAMEVSGGHGVLLSGLIFDAGIKKSEVLLRVGGGHDEEGDNGDNGENGGSAATNPSGLYDVFFRVGGPAAGKVETALVVDSSNVILDNIWAWRADHGSGVGWTVNTSDTGVVINGDNVTAYGLFVEHFQKFNVIWNGNGGTDIFFQNELPYDPPTQAAWMEAPGVDGFAAFKIGEDVESFSGYGMGSYSFFNKIYNGGKDIFAANGFEVPTTLRAASLHDVLTIFLDKVNGTGGILNVVNNTGGSSTAANADKVVPVISYP